MKTWNFTQAEVETKLAGRTIVCTGRRSGEYKVEKVKVCGDEVIYYSNGLMHTLMPWETAGLLRYGNYTYKSRPESVSLI